MLHYVLLAFGSSFCDSMNTDLTIYNPISLISKPDWIAMETLDCYGGEMWTFWNESSHIFRFSKVFTSLECHVLKDIVDRIEPSNSSSLQCITDGLQLPLWLSHTMQRIYYCLEKSYGRPIINHVPEKTTISRHLNGSHLGWHYDKLFEQEFLKACIYLADSTGVDFYGGPGQKVLKVAPNQGDVVIFDMALRHRSNPAIKLKTKYVIGLRLGFNNI